MGVICIMVNARTKGGFMATELEAYIARVNEETAARLECLRDNNMHDEVQAWGDFVSCLISAAQKFHQLGHADVGLGILVKFYDNSWDDFDGFLMGKIDDTFLKWEATENRKAEAEHDAYEDDVRFEWINSRL